ncbi:MAG: hypothetical protein ABIP50_02535 [Candidatus Saccharimonadales bacterium]
MAKGQNRTGLIVTIVVLGLTLAIVSTIVILNGLNKPKVEETTSKTDSSKTEPTTTTTDSDKGATTTPATTKPAPSVDPSTLSSIDVDPLKITVFYTKGAGALEYSVKRTADRTQYVEFSAPGLVGTKCTDDAGVFASIIENPASTEDNTSIVQKTTAGDKTYGLTLAGTNCANDQELLATYQTAFKNGFSSLKVME